MKSSRRLWILPALALLAALACTLGGPPPATRPPLPGDTPPGATPTLIPTLDIPTLPPTDGSGGPLQEAILISHPGPNSQVISPLLVEGEADPTFEQNLVVTVSDVEGNVIATQPTSIAADIGERGPFSAEVAFSVASEQPGRVSVYDVSARDGGLIHLASVEVTLLAGGSATLVEAPSHPETIAIQQPPHLGSVSGGTLQVSGYSEYFFESNLGVVICGEGGRGAPNQLCGTEDNVLASGFATIASPDVGQPGPFSGEVTYSIPALVRGRVVVYAASPRDGGLLHVSSRVIDLNP